MVFGAKKIASLDRCLLLASLSKHFSGISIPVGFAKPIGLESRSFHENDGNRENDEDNSDSDSKGIGCWRSENHGNHGNDENHGNLGFSKPIGS